MRCINSLDQGLSAAPDTQLQTRRTEVHQMARPLINEDKKKSASLPSIRLTQQERNLIDDKAATAGLSVTEFVRVLALTERVKPRKTKLDASLLVELNNVGVELSRHGNNLNQVAHALNSDRTPNIEYLEAVISHQQATIRELRSLMEKLDASI